MNKPDHIRDVASLETPAASIATSSPWEKANGDPHSVEYRFLHYLNGNPDKGWVLELRQPQADGTMRYGTTSRLSTDKIFETIRHDLDHAPALAEIISDAFYNFFSTHHATGHQKNQWSFTGNDTGIKIKHPAIEIKILPAPEGDLYLILHENKQASRLVGKTAEIRQALEDKLHELDKTVFAEIMEAIEQTTVAQRSCGRGL